MGKSELEETRDFWNRVADGWQIQVGDDGDSNRRLNSDPVLQRFAGDVNGLAVLDAGCGTGYLSRKFQKQGARVTGIDFSERMIAIARARHPDLDSRVDSCSELATLEDEHYDLLVTNYVLMDTGRPWGNDGGVQPCSETGGVGGAGILPSVVSPRPCHRL